MSRRQVKQLVRIGQSWEHLETGRVWRVAQNHPGDGAVELVAADESKRYPTYGQLGNQYQLAESDGE